MHPYASAAYAHAFENLAQPLSVPQFGTYVLLRSIDGNAAVDAMGTYPLCALERDARLAEGIEVLRDAGAISIVLVPDAFFGPAVDALAAFDLCTPFKLHFVHERSQPFRYDSHHRYEVKRARAQCEVREAPLSQYQADWRRLYATLVARRGISGVQRFSDLYFSRLSALAGLRCHVALKDSAVLAMHLWIEHAGVAYSHLAASDEAGYQARAGYALNDFALERFGAAAAIDFGAAAGTRDEPSDGLAKFKRGFSNARRMFYLCGKVLDAPAYERLSAGRAAGGYFPAYRA